MSQTPHYVGFPREKKRRKRSQLELATLPEPNPPPPPTSRGQTDSGMKSLNVKEFCVVHQTNAASDAHRVGGAQLSLRREIRTGTEPAHTPLPRPSPAALPSAIRVYIFLKVQIIPVTLFVVKYTTGCQRSP